MASGKRYAVVVGVNGYPLDTSLGSLEYCASDAEALYDALLTYAHFDATDIALFSDGAHPNASRPGYSDILSAVERVCRSATEEDLILFFFAGHGEGDGADSYLLTPEYRPNVVADSSISLQKLNAYFDQSKAKFKIRIFDACHSGRLGRRGGGGPASLAHLAIDAEGWATLAACKEDQFSHELQDIEHGIFSYFLIRGLSGLASSDHKTVTLDDLKLYVLDKTIELTKKRGLVQTPVFKGDQAGRLVLCDVAAPPVADIPANVERIVSSEPAALEPSPGATAEFLLELTDMLKDATPVSGYVYSDKAARLEAATKLGEASMGLASALAGRELPAGHKLSAKRSALAKCPLNNSLATFVQGSAVGALIECEFSHATVTRYKDEWGETTEEPNFGMSALSLMRPKVVRRVKVSVPYEEKELSGISEAKDWPECATSIDFLPVTRAYPTCSCTTVLLPWTYGIYFCAYFAASRPTKGMGENWDPGSFSVREFKAMPVADAAGWLRSEWETLFAQFVSFVAECVKARHMAIDGALVLKPLKL